MWRTAHEGKGEWRCLVADWTQQRDEVTVWNRHLVGPELSPNGILQRPTASWRVSEVVPAALGAIRFRENSVI